MGLSATTNQDDKFLCVACGWSYCNPAATAPMPAKALEGMIRALPRPLFPLNFSLLRVQMWTKLQSACVTCRGSIASILRGDGGESIRSIYSIPLHSIACVSISRWHSYYSSPSSDTRKLVFPSNTGIPRCLSSSAPPHPLPTPSGAGSIRFRRTHYKKTPPLPTDPQLATSSAPETSP